MSTQKPSDSLKNKETHLQDSLRASQTEVTPIYPNSQNVEDRIIDNLMALTCSAESTQIGIEPDGTYTIMPIRTFYYCSSNRPTIGFGCQIFLENGKLHAEGKERIDQLHFYCKREPIPREHNVEIFNQCLNNKKRWDAYISRKYVSNQEYLESLTDTQGEKLPKSPLRNFFAQTQEKILFCKDPIPTDKSNEELTFSEKLQNNSDVCYINKQDAWDLARVVYKKTKNSILNDPALQDRSFFLDALLSDTAYQNGIKGTRDRSSVYKSAKKGIVQPIQGKCSSERGKIRKLLSIMAHQVDLAKSKNKATRSKTTAHVDSKKQFVAYALKNYVNEFKQSIEKSEKLNLVLMEQFLTLTFMECARGTSGKQLTLEEIKQAEKEAQHLVYNVLFREGLNNDSAKIACDAIEGLNINDSSNLPLKTLLSDAIQKQTQLKNGNSPSSPVLANHSDNITNDQNNLHPDGAGHEQPVTLAFQNDRW